MADSTTVGPGFTKPEVGGSDSTWGGKLNANFDSQAAELTKTYAGNPNGFVAGVYVGQTLWDSTNQIRWTCKTAGSAGGAVWKETGGKPSGHKDIFPHISAAPQDYSIDTTAALNNAALRIVTSAPGANNGGSLDFTTAFAASRTSDGHTLVISEIPAHTHGAGTYVDGGATTGISAGSVTMPSGSATDGSGGISIPTAGGIGAISSITRPANQSVAGTSGSTGSGGAHTHGMPSFAVKYADSCICIHG